MPAATITETLTDRETDIMDLLSLGLTNQAIAAKARLAEKAVRNYLTVVFEKLGVPHRAFAARAWRLLKSGSRGSTT